MCRNSEKLEGSFEGFFLFFPRSPHCPFDLADSTVAGGTLYGDSFVNMMDESDTVDVELEEKGKLLNDELEEEGKLLLELPHRPVVRAAKEEGLNLILAELKALENELPSLKASFRSMQKNESAQKRARGQTLFLELATRIRDLLEEANLLSIDLPSHVLEVQRFEKLFSAWEREIEAISVERKVGSHRIKAGSAIYRLCMKAFATDDSYLEFISQIDEQKALMIQIARAPVQYPPVLKAMVYTVEDSSFPEIKPVAYLITPRSGSINVQVFNLEHDLLLEDIAPTTHNFMHSCLQSSVRGRREIH